MQSIRHPRGDRKVAQKPFANNSPSDYRSARQTSESHDDNNHLAFIPKPEWTPTPQTESPGRFCFPVSTNERQD
jgi:hypothetical protein